MKFKKSITIFILLIFSIYLATPALAGTFTLEWTYQDDDGDPQTAWRWWFDAADYSSATVKATANNANTSTTVDYSALSDDSHTLNLEVSDGIDWSVKDSITINIDTVFPTLTITDPSVSWQNSDITVNIQHGDTGSGVATKRYKITNNTTKPTSGWTDLTSTNQNINITNNGQWYVHVQIIDVAGNETYNYKGPFKLDKELPTAPVINPTTTAWTKNDVTFTITNGNDTVSGVQKSQYKIDTGTWTDYSGEVTISNEGTHTIYARTLDNVNNIGTEASITVNIDKTNPVVNYSSTSRDWAETDISVDMTFSDTGGSLFKHQRYSWTTDTNYPSSWTSGWNTATSVTATQSSKGVWYLHVEFEDNAGNLVYEYQGPYRLNHKPIGTITSPPEATWTN